MAALALSGVVSASEGTATSQEELILSQCRDAASLRQYEVMMKKGAELKRLGKASGNETIELTGESYEIRGMISLRDTTDITTRINHLQEKAEEAERNGDWKAVCTYGSPVSLYYHFVANDFSQASLYAFKCLTAARKQNDAIAETNALSALASIYFTKRESSGYSYALEAYNMAQKIHSLPSLYGATCNLANYLYNQGKPAEALQYLQEATSIKDSLRMEWENAYLYSFFGDIYNALGNDAQAEKYYTLGLRDYPHTTVYDKAYAHICYALYLISRKRYQDALAQLYTTNEITSRNKISIFDTEIALYQSMSHEKLGNFKEALDAHKRYMDAYQKVTTEANAKEFAILDLRYRVAQEKSINAAQSVEIMLRGWIIFAIAAILLIVVIIAAFIYLRAKKQMKTNKEKVKLYLENLETERDLRKQLESALVECKPREGARFSEDKQTELFERFKQMLETEKIYLNQDLSLEKAAEMLNTNRTYLSQVVNDQSGLSFPLYVNSYRLKEAINLLSDPNNNEPLKNICYNCGFATTSSFYNLFKQKTGMAPSVFRQNVKDLYIQSQKDGKNQQNDN